MENKKGERRKMHMVKMEFQRNFILKFCSLVILTALIISAIVYYISASTTTAIFRNSRLELVTTADFILPVLFWGSLASIITVGLAAAAVTFVISFRIAGPLFRIEKDITAFAAGKLDVCFHVRNKDQMQDLVTSLNSMADNIRQGITEAKKQADGLAKAHLPEEAREKVEALKKTLDKFET
jgi:methyl-accepting chemotaxis protein